jgi:hypothetical protein
MNIALDMTNLEILLADHLNRHWHDLCKHDYLWNHERIRNELVPMSARWDDWGESSENKRARKVSGPFSRLPGWR